MRRLLLLLALVLVLCTACAADEETVTESTTSTTAPILPDGACVARMSDPNPGQGGSETVIVDSHFAGVPMTITAHYKSKDSTYSANVGANKHGEHTFSIGQPTAGHTVTVDVVVGNETAGEKCQASFTPN